MAFPVVESSQSTGRTSAETTSFVQFPLTVSPGALIVCIARVAVAGAIGWPASWVELAEDDSDASDDVTAIAYFTAVGNEDGSFFSVTHGNGKSAYIVYSITGAAAPATQAPQISTVAVGTSIVPDPSSLTPTGGAKDYLWLWLGGWDGEATSPPAGNPTNYTDPLGASTGTAGQPYTHCRVASAQRNLNAASEDPPSWTVSTVNSGWSAWTMAVHPGAAQVTLAAVQAGVGTAAAALTVARPLAAASAGVATAAAALAIARPLAAASAGVASATAALAVARPLAAASNGGSTATAALAVARPLAAAAAGVGAASASLAVARPLAAASTGTSTATAALTTTRTFGKLTDGASTITTGGDALYVSKFTLSEVGNVTKLTVRCWADTAGNLAKGIIYNDSSGAPGAFKAVSNEVTVNNTTEQAIDFAFTSPVAMTAGDWWLGILFDAAITPNAFNVSRDDTASQRKGKSITYPTYPDPFGSPLDGAGPLDVYATYIPALVLAAASAGVSTATAALAVARPLAAASAGASTAAAALAVARPLAASAAGTSTATAALTVTAATVNLAAVATGVGTATAALAVARPLAASSVGAASSTAALAVSRPLAAAASGVGTATATLAVARPLAATAGGVATATASLAVARPLAAVSAGTGVATAAVAVARPLAATSVGVGTAAAVLAVARPLAATSVGAGVASATLAVSRPLAASASGVSTATAALTVTAGGGAVELAASASGAGHASASLTVGTYTFTVSYRGRIRSQDSQRFAITTTVSRRLAIRLSGEERL